MKKELILSIIIPCYNIESYIEKNIQSVIAQNIEDMEIIYVDDGCTDHTAEIIEAYQKSDSRIQIVRTKNEGIGTARNKGVLQARGRFIYFLDGDDYIKEGGLAQLLKIACQNELEILQFYHQKVDINGKVLGKCSLRNHPHKIMKGEEWMLQDDMVIYMADYLFSKKLLDKSQVEFPEGILSEDHIYLPNVVLCADRICSNNQILCNYVQRQDSIMHSNHLRRTKDILKIIDIRKKEWTGREKERLYKGFFLRQIVSLYNSVIYNSCIGKLSLKELL